MRGAPSQNGVAKRQNRTLKDMVRSMISHSALPKSLWDEAVKIAVSGTSKKNVQNKQDKEITCFFCKKVGHMKNTCTKYVASREKKGTLLNFSFEILEHIQ